MSIKRGVRKPRVDRTSEVVDMCNRFAFQPCDFEATMFVSGQTQNGVEVYVDKMQRTKSG